MDKLKLKRYNEIVLTCLALMLGTAFVFSVYHLYLSGGAVPYSRERVGEYLLWLLPLSLLSVASAILSGILSSLVYKKEEARAFTTPRVLYDRRISRVDLSKISPEDTAKILRERARRKYLLLSVLFVVLVYLTVALIFALNPARYTIEGCNEEIAILSLILFPPAIIIIGFAVVVSKMYDESLLRESEIYKSSYDTGNRGEGKKDGRLAVFFNKNREKAVLCARIIIVSLSLVFIVLGAFNGTVADVLGKAIKICTECIGLG